MVNEPLRVSLSFGGTPALGGLLAQTQSPTCRCNASAPVTHSSGSAPPGILRLVPSKFDAEGHKQPAGATSPPRPGRYCGERGADMFAYPTQRITAYRASRRVKKLHQATSIREDRSGAYRPNTGGALCTRLCNGATTTECTCLGSALDPQAQMGDLRGASINPPHAGRPRFSHEVCMSPNCKHCGEPAVMVANGQVKCLACGRSQEVSEYATK